MSQHDFERLNVISERALVDKITSEELKEFNKLIDDWSASTEFNVLAGFNRCTNSK